MATKKVNKKKASKNVKAALKATKLETSSSYADAAMRIPARLLAPIGAFLTNQLQTLERRRARLDNDDPFLTGREDSLASPDTNASEQFGHARIEAVRNQLDKRIIQVRKALAQVKVGSYGTCERCGKMIDTDRLMVFPEATLCVSCEMKKEKR
jgi:RNA polymerase-binding transcription factor DksA